MSNTHYITEKLMEDDETKLTLLEKNNIVTVEDKKNHCPDPWLTLQFAYNFTNTLDDKLHASTQQLTWKQTAWTGILMK